MGIFGRKREQNADSLKNEIISFAGIPFKISSSLSENVDITPEGTIPPSLSEEHLAQSRAMLAFIEQLKEKLIVKYSSNMQGGYTLKSELNGQDDLRKGRISYDTVIVAAKAFAETYIDDTTKMPKPAVHAPVDHHMQRLAAMNARRPLTVVTTYFQNIGRPLDPATVDGLRSMLEAEYAKGKTTFQKS